MTTQQAAKQLAYLAGPMRGYPEYNFPAFHAAAAKLRAHGLEVWSPAEHDVNEDGFDPAKDTAQPMRHYMRRDLPAVLAADMVCVLEGWEKSKGATLEVHVAQACGIPVYRSDTLQPISAPSAGGGSEQRQLAIETFITTVAGPSFTREEIRKEAEAILAGRWPYTNAAPQAETVPAANPPAAAVAAPVAWSPTASTSRDAVIEEVAKHIEASPMTYFGPDPGGLRDLRYLIVAAIRGLKGRP